jgi:hypothetical protein
MRFRLFHLKLEAIVVFHSGRTLHWELRHFRQWLAAAWDHFQMGIHDTSLSGSAQESEVIETGFVRDKIQNEKSSAHGLLLKERFGRNRKLPLSNGLQINLS